MKTVKRYFEVKPIRKKYPKARYYYILGGRGCGKGYHRTVPLKSPPQNAGNKPEHDRQPEKETTELIEPVAARHELPQLQHKIRHDCFFLSNRPR